MFFLIFLAPLRQENIAITKERSVRWDLGANWWIDRSLLESPGNSKGNWVRTVQVETR